MFGLTKLVEDCHKQGIRVNLDVVFNHVYDKDTHAFENTVPNYYFQMNENGDFSNGTYCGNDVDSSRKMCHKYIVDACTYLVRTYHIDGVRFDLMGILDVATINAVYEACTALNPDFMVYGEGWDMPSFLDSRKRASISNNAQMPYVAHFSDRFRDVVKGRTNTNEAVSYTHLDVYKRQEPACPIWQTAAGCNGQYKEPASQCQTALPMRLPESVKF